jgi:hypothetical protein
MGVVIPLPQTGPGHAVLTTALNTYTSTPILYTRIPYFLQVVWFLCEPKRGGYWPSPQPHSGPIPPPWPRYVARWMLHCSWGAAWRCTPRSPRLQVKSAGFLGSFAPQPLPLNPPGLLAPSPSRGGGRAEPPSVGAGAEDA